MYKILTRIDTFSKREEESIFENKIQFKKNINFNKSW